MNAAPLASALPNGVDKAGPLAAVEAKAREVAEEFEGFFISMMLETMSSGLEIDPIFGGGHGEAVYRSMLNDEYARTFARAGGIDVQILGIGTNGHIGFNEPGRTLHARTHRVRLKPETRRSNAGLFCGKAAAVPAEALSMGMGTILKARSIVLLATGASKAACIERVVNGPITTELPASFLQLHADVTIMLDAPAAGRLGRRAAT